MCQSSWLMWISFFNPEHEIIVSALLWLGTRGPAKIIREKQCSNTQGLERFHGSLLFETICHQWDYHTWEWVRETLHDITSHGCEKTSPSWCLISWIINMTCDIGDGIKSFSVWLKITAKCLTMGWLAQAWVMKIVSLMVLYSPKTSSSHCGNLKMEVRGTIFFF